MPETDSKLGSRRELAVAQLEAELLSWGARRLAKHELELYQKRQFVTGWRLPFAFEDRVREIDLLVQPDAPFVPVRIALLEPPPFLTWPHVEEDGVLCVWPDGASFSQHDVVGVTKELLQDAEALIAKCVNGQNRDDFLTEFDSYWSKTLDVNPTVFLSLALPRAPSRFISVFKGEKLLVLGETAADVSSWMNNRYRVKSVKCETAAFLWLDRPLHPEEYPRTTADIWDIAAQLSADGREVLAQLAKVQHKRAIVMFGADTANGPCLAGLTLHAPQHRAVGGKLVNSLEKGFRPGHVPESLVVERFWRAGSSAQRSSVARMDAAWIHGRGHDERQPVLKKNRVVIVGGGSIGAHIGVQLAMAGVGEIRLVDPETLRSANTGRHPLGAKHVNENKAQALAAELRQNYPHLSFDARKERWQDVMRREPEFFGNSDLILSATGDWGSESELNEWQYGVKRTPPILYVWTEAHACAGHAVAILKDGGCLECGFWENGNPRLPITVWSEETVRQEPGCGALFQPYGPMELAHTVTLASEMGLDVLLGKTKASTHRIWACLEEFLVASGGEWSPEYIEMVQGDHRGGQVMRRDWPSRDSCFCCCAKGMAA